MTSPAPWPLPGKPYFLNDGWPDEGPQDCVSVPATVVLGTDDDSAAQSLEDLETRGLDFIGSFAEGRRMLSELRRHGSELKLDSNATTCHRPDATLEGDYWVHVDPNRLCEHCQGKPTGDKPCTECTGSRKFTIHYDKTEGCPWVICDPDAPNAVDFFAFDVVDLPRVRLSDYDELYPGQVGFVLEQLDNGYIVVGLDNPVYFGMSTTVHKDSVTPVPEQEQDDDDTSALDIAPTT